MFLNIIFYYLKLIFFNKLYNKYILDANILITSFNVFIMLHIYSVYNNIKK